MSNSLVKELIEFSLNEVSIPSKAVRDDRQNLANGEIPVSYGNPDLERFTGGHRQAGSDVGIPAGAVKSIEFTPQKDDFKFTPDFGKEEIEFELSIGKSKVTDLQTKNFYTPDKSGVAKYVLSTGNILNPLSTYLKEHRIPTEQLKNILQNLEQYLNDNKQEIGYYPTYTIYLYRSYSISIAKTNSDGTPAPEKKDIVEYFGSLKTKSLDIDPNKFYTVINDRSEVNYKFIKSDPETNKFIKSTREDKLDKEKTVIGSKMIGTKYTIESDSQGAGVFSNIYVGEIEKIEEYTRNSLGSVITDVLRNYNEFIEEFLQYQFGATKTELVDRETIDPKLTGRLAIEVFDKSIIYLNKDNDIVDYNKNSIITSAKFIEDPQFHEAKLDSVHYRENFIEKYLKSKQTDGLLVNIGENNTSNIIKDNLFKFSVYLGQNNAEKGKQWDNKLSSYRKNGDWYLITDNLKVNKEVKEIDRLKDIYTYTLNCKINTSISEDDDKQKWDDKIVNSVDELIKFIKIEAKSIISSEDVNKFITDLQSKIGFNFSDISIIDPNDKNQFYTIKLALGFKSPVKFGQTIVGNNAYVMYDKDDVTHVGLTLKTEAFGDLLAILSDDILFVKNIKDQDIEKLSNLGISIQLIKNFKGMDVIDSEQIDDYRKINIVKKTGESEEIKEFILNKDTKFNTLVNDIAKLFEPVVPEAKHNQLTISSLREIKNKIKSELGDMYSDIKVKYTRPRGGTGSDVLIDNVSILIELKDDFDKTFVYSDNYNTFKSFGVKVENGIATISLPNDGFDPGEFEVFKKEIIDEHKVAGVKESVLSEDLDKITINLVGFTFDGTKDVKIDSAKISLQGNSNGLKIANPGTFELDIDGIKESIEENYDDNYSEIELKLDEAKVSEDDAIFSAEIYSYDPSFDNIVINSGKFEIPYSIHNDKENEDESGVAYSNDYYFKESDEFKSKMMEFIKAVKFISGQE